MKYDKIVFIANAFHQPRVKKRIQEFLKRGYDVEVYGFDRDTETDTSDWGVETKCVGRLPSSMPYHNRLKKIYSGIREVLKQEKDQNAIFYLFQLDVALIFTLLSGRDYIYEESDLVHTQLSNRYLRNFLERRDQSIIKRSQFSVFTSDGFPKFHFGHIKDNHWITIPNKLDTKIESFPLYSTKPTPCGRLSIGFVGFPRYKSVVKFADMTTANFENIDFHFFGKIVEANQKYFKELEKRANCYFHGQFKNPEDLSSIYSQIDLVLSTYGDDTINTRYAEPNKLYEAIYFETPIIVSKGTFLADQVRKYDIGFEVDCNDEEGIINFLKVMTRTQIDAKIDSCRKIPKPFCISNPDLIFIYLENL